MKWYVIMKLTFATEEDKKVFKKMTSWERKTKPTPMCEYTDAPGDGRFGTAGNPSNHFPSVRIKMHELNKNETNPTVFYHVMTTNY